MHDDVGIIQQHPVLGVVALGAVGLQALLRKLVLHLVGQRGHLRGGGTGGDDEVIGQDGQAFYLEHPYILRLLLVQNLGDLNGKRLAVVEIIHVFLPSVGTRPHPVCRALFLLLLSGARCLTIGGHSAGKVGIAAEDGVIGFLIDASHILHVGIGGCAAVGPLVGDHVQLAYLHRAGVGAEILVEQVCDGAGIRHHAGVAGKGVGLAHVGHAHEHRRLRQNDVGAVDLEEGRQQLCDGGDIHIRVDIVLEYQRQLVQDIGNAHGAGALEQTCVEVALHIQAVDIGVCVAVAVAAAHKELCRGTIQIAVALQQLTAAVGHIPGDIHLDAAEVIHHFHQRLHINGDIVVDGQVVLVVDDICQRGNAAAVGKRHRVDLVVGNGIGLAVGEGKLVVLGGHQRVAGDLQHPQRTALDIELAVQDQQFCIRMFIP